MSTSYSERECDQVRRGLQLMAEQSDPQMFNDSKDEQFLQEHLEDWLVVEDQCALLAGDNPAQEEAYRQQLQASHEKILDALVDRFGANTVSRWCQDVLQAFGEK